jgi:hypothetical protein
LALVARTRRPVLLGAGLQTSNQIWSLEREIEIPLRAPAEAGHCMGNPMYWEQRLLDLVPVALARLT